MKINPFDYLFYKLTRFMTPLVFYSPEAHAPKPMFVIFFFNAWAILNVAIGDLNIKVYIPIFVITVILILILVEVFYSPNRRWRKIEAKYENEVDNHRILGNWLVVLYVAATIGLLVWSFQFIPTNS